MKLTYLAIMALFAVSAYAQQQAPLYAQCGGIGYPGPTQCTAGNICIILSDYYYQCLPDTTPCTATTTRGPITSTTVPPYSQTCLGTAATITATTHTCSSSQYGWNRVCTVYTTPNYYVATPTSDFTIETTTWDHIPTER